MPPSRNRSRALDPASLARALMLIVAALPAPACLPATGFPDRGPAAERDPSLRLLVLPDDEAGSWLEAMAGARRRLWVEMYLLTDDRAIQTLVTASARGADVRALLEPAPFGDETANLDAFATLGRAGIDVRWFAVPGGLVHAKVVLSDEVAWISTANLTSAGLDRNREMVVADADPADVGRVEALWQADAIGWAAPPAAMPEGAAASRDTGRGATDSRILASPVDARARLTAVVDGAQASVRLEVEEMSDPDFVGRLIAAHDRGVGVSVVIPAGEGRSAATTAAAARLASAGVDVRATGGPPLHAKAMTVDDGATGPGHVPLAYLGSVNFTRASFDDNREVGLLSDDPGIVRRIRDAIGRDGASGVPP